MSEYKPLSDEEMNRLFEQLLDVARMQAALANGSTPDDALYDQANTIEPSQMEGYIYVTYKGERYGPVRATWGPLDGDKNKSTVLIQTTDGLWVKLWYLNPKTE